MFKNKKSIWTFLLSTLMFLLMAGAAFAGEADIQLPDLTQVAFMGGSLQGLTILNVGLIICLIGMAFGIMQYVQTKNLPAHKAMLDVSQTIWETCKTYLFQQGKFLIALWILIAICIVYYFGALQGKGVSDIIIILICSILGILGSYTVAWFGIRINTVANSRAAFSSLSGNPLNIVNICLRSGMSVGLLLVSIELFFMIIILAYIPKELAGPSFIGFAIGESLGASALRICGGIFTKIADIGSDLMKIVFHLPEDDPKNPGVIADCTGDNAGDSVGPTADGFETYGVTGVALIAFLALALASNPEMGGKLIVWIFAMRILMILTSLASYFVNDVISKAAFGGKKEFNFEHPLTNLVWITSIVSIAVTFVASYYLLGDLTEPYTSLWWALAIIISCGTIAGALIPEFTKVFTSTSSRHCEETVNASKQGGPSLNILSGLVAGNFSAFWEGLTILILMFIAYMVSKNPAVMALMPPEFTFAAPVFAFGLVAFGFLGMGPVTIAVDSFGPVSDNAQSIYELSLIESRPDAKDVVKKEYGIAPDFELAKHFLESADGAGNTFKATAKPVLIGTAVVGATTMVFGIIILLEHLFGNVVAKLSLVQPEIILGLIMGGAVIYWFTGASIQAVTTGAYQAVVFIKKNINLDKAEASIEDSKEVVKICTQYAQKGMINIFIVIFFMCLALAFFNPYFFIGYLIGIAFFGLFQAIFMANAGGCWDNAKKIVEVDLKMKNTPLHEASVVGDTVGDPFKDTSSVSLNPVIKFTTLFGLLATEIAVTMTNPNLKTGLAIFFFLIAIVFVYRSFYSMRIASEKLGE
ncbi:MAG TPA: sodium-translocating pyrophosphatase [Smithella sp.]|jgi:K(+)-stimulated pyrophosphate-energized sodium pump|nr:sodium-translocating pyrophosphatase [Smithella sp.]HOE32594.1 sodium-translocating pyrophosphatase [Smithella sp.]HOG09024.1 sodium-translocating pyrophosphatase [Smithella sp.]HOO35660.1 sodium-translocating pyrophosphatase [Smithella sp.]HOS14400.1 sodium-translocating pyrophosphatase [Smithella sp.]